MVSIPCLERFSLKMIRTELVEFIRTKLDSDSLSDLNPELKELHPASLAETFDAFEAEEIGVLLSHLDPSIRAETFGRLPLEKQKAVVESLSLEDTAHLVEAMSHDERADLLQKLAPDDAEAILRRLAKSVRDDIRRLTSYPEGTCGAIMTSDYCYLSETMPAAQAIAFLRQVAPDRETIYTAYVVDENRKLLGSVSLKNLILASPNKPVGEIMMKDVPSVKTSDPQEEAARKIAKYDVIAVPVTNGDDSLVGIITFDDALDVAESEATEDIHRIGSVNALTVSLREASYKLLVLKRLPWLLVLVLVNILSGAGIAYFEDVIMAHIALVFFLPLLIASSGNAGSQSATLMIRSISTGDVVLRDWFYLLRKEIIVSIFLGILMGVAVSLVGYAKAGVDIAFVVAFTMIAVVVVGSLMGMSLPFLLQKFNFDPATASAPLVTSLADISGVLIYFSIASWYLGLQVSVGI